MENQIDPNDFESLDKKKCRPNLAATLQLGGLITAIGGGLVSFTCKGLALAASIVVGTGGLITAVAGCIKDCCSVKKCVCCISNFDNLYEKVKNAEEEAKRLLGPCYKKVCNLKDVVPIDGKDIEELKLICSSVRDIYPESRIAMERKKMLVVIFEKNSNLLNASGFDGILPEYVQNEIDKHKRFSERITNNGLLSQSIQESELSNCDSLEEISV